MTFNLSEGAIEKIMTGGEVVAPVLQIMGSKEISGQKSNVRYRILISDGVYYNSYAMLASHLTPMLANGELADNSIVRVNNHVASIVKNAEKGDKRIMVVLDLEVLKHGSEVGMKIGNPVMYDASTSQQNQAAHAPRPSRSTESNFSRPDPPRNSTAGTTVPPVTTTIAEELTTELPEDHVNGNSTEKPGGPVAEELRRPMSKCYTGGLEGVCLSADACYTAEGQASSLCPHSAHLYCCAFVHTCGDLTSQKISYFRSPDFPAKSAGSLACDFDVIVQSNTCAVRVDYINVNLARKFAGVCDIDQLFILNSVDGPTAGQCGPLSGYSTTVAVNPGQIKPVKIAVLIQNEATYYWELKITQLACNQVKHFRAPRRCGEVRNEIFSASATGNYGAGYLSNPSWRGEEERWRSQGPQHTWWNYPEPIFNNYYYRTTKRHMVEGGVGRRRVVSGADAYLGEFPWTVAIGMDNMFFCGGALISDNLILTAAHCVMTRDTPIGSLVVHVGDLDLINENETVHELRSVVKILFHSHFHPFLLANDIALLKLDEPVIFSETIQPACLPRTGDTHTGETATVVGWGVTSFPMGDPSPVLQKLEVETISNFQCGRLIEEPVSLGMLCASPTHKQGTCFGDSGGPLTIQDKSGRNILVGVVSFGVTGCAVRPAFPDLYTRVSEYIKWIEVNAL